MIIKVLQWNIWYQENVENILKTLKKIDADILCLQEVTTDSTYNPNLDVPKYFSEELNLNYFYKKAQGWRLKGNKRAMGNAIFSKFPITRKYFKFIQEPTTRPNSLGYNEGRIYIEVELEINNSKLTVGTTHMSFNPWFEVTKNKKNQTKILVNIMEKKSSDFIFTGDFNSTPDLYPIKQFLKILKNAGPELDKNTFSKIPWNDGGFEVNGLEYRIDYIFCTLDIKVLSSKIVESKYSDHLPILVECRIS